MSFLQDEGGAFDFGSLGTQKERRMSRKEAQRSVDHEKNTRIYAERELNQAGGSSGSKPANVTTGDGGGGWIARQILRVKEQAAESGRRLEEVIEERWGSVQEFEKLWYAVNDYDWRKSGERRSQTSFRRPRDDQTSGSERSTSFRRPAGDDQNGGSERSTSFRRPSGDEDSRERGREFVRPGSDKGDRIHNAFEKPRERESDRSRPSHQQSSSSYSTGRRSDSDSRQQKSKGLSQKAFAAVHGHESKFQPATQIEQIVVPQKEVEQPDSAVRETVPLTAEDLNRLNAKILKAEMKGDKALAAKIKAKIESGVKEVENGASTSEGDQPQKPREKNIQLLTRTDERTGLTVPIRGSGSADSVTSKKRKLAEQLASGQDTSLRDLVAEERSTTAEDHLRSVGDITSKLVDSGRSTKTTDDFVVDDLLLERQVRTDEREGELKRKRDIDDFKKREATLESCRHCIDSRHIQKHLVIARGQHAYVALPATKPLLEDGHCFVVPNSHVAAANQLDEDVFAEMRDWVQAIAALFRSRKQELVVLEAALGVRKAPHMLLECVALPIDDGIAELAPMYFKKAILECEGEWLHNKRLVELSKQKDIRRSIPRGFSYFSVEFVPPISSTVTGYAHAIEDEGSFPKDFGRGIAAGMLGLDTIEWKHQPKQTLQQQVNACANFTKALQPYDHDVRKTE